MRKYKKVLIIISSTVVFLLIAAVTLSIVYEKKITNYFLSEINQNMEAQIRAKNINFSLIEKFPFASIRLDSMSVVPKDSLLPPLYAAKTTFLEFNVIDMLSGIYTIRNIDIRKGNIYAYTAKSQTNYKLFKDSGKEGKFTFALRNVRMTDVSLTVEEAENEFLIRSILETAAIKGKFTESEYNLTVALEGKMREIKSRDIVFLKDKSISLSSELLVKSDVYSIENCSLALQGLNFTVEGKVSDKNENVTTDLKIIGNAIAIRDLYTLLPEKLIPRELDEYHSQGNIDFTAAISGPVSSSAFKADFNIKNGSLYYKPENVELKNISLNGTLHNGKGRNMRSTALQISTFYAESQGGRVSGNFAVNNFSQPQLKMNVKAVTTLQHIMPFIKQDVVRKASGKVEIQAHYAGPLKQAKTTKDLQSVKSGGTVRLKQVDLELKNEPVVVKELNASLILDKNDLMISSLDLGFNGTKFSVKGRFDNLIPSLFSGDERIQAYLDLSSEDADLTAFLPKGDEKQSKDGSLTFPFSAGRMNMNFLKARYGRFEATDVSGTLSLDGSRLDAENIQFSTMGGKVRFNGAADFMIKGITVKGHADLKQLNISTLFYVFNNFSQTALTHEQLNGDADAEINFQASWNHKHEFDPNSLHAICDLTIEKGQLQNFEPVYHLSNFISLSELKDIRFSRLHNNFVIKDGKVIFPEMVINSTALNLTCSGTHYFNNKVDYHFDLALNDILWQKVRKAKPQNEEFGVEEEDDKGKIRLYISMAGDIDSPVFTYDRKSFRKNLQEEAKNEKLLVKSLLKKDLGIFKADTTLRVAGEKKEKPLKIDWNESGNDQQPSTEKRKKEKEKKKVGKFIDKIAKPGSEEKSGENSDDFN